jgi:hypothetical protein
MSFLYIPGLVAWIIFVVQEGSIHWLWFVLGSHIWIALVPYLCVISNEVIYSPDDRETFLDHSSLKLTICISPILVLLMLNTGPPREMHRELLKKLSATVSLEMFDAIEILDKWQTSQAIPDQFKLTVGVLILISLLTTPLELMEISVQDSGKVQTLKAPFTVRLLLQVIVSNCAFLAVRLILWLYFGEKASIFLVKNVIKITTGCLEVCSVFKLCGCSDEDEDDKPVIDAIS